MTSRVAGDVYVLNGVNGNSSLASATDVTTSGGVTLISVNTTGCNQFAVTNRGSINVYVLGSFDGEFFAGSTNVYRQIGGGAYSAVECVSASTMASFEGPFKVVKVVANSGSGVYRATLTYR